MKRSRAAQNKKKAKEQKGARFTAQVKEGETAGRLGG